MRIASLTTIRSGVITSRIEVVERSRRMSFIATRLRTRRSMSSNTASLGSDMSSIPANGRAAATIGPRKGNTFSSHQVQTSGNDSSRSVSPGGRAVHDDRVELARLVVVLDLQQREQLVHAGRHGELLGRDAVHARGRPAGRPSHADTASQLLSISVWACTSWPNRPGSISVGRLLSSLSNESDSEWAGSVESTTVRSPAAAQRRAVAAATLVLPTPPLPV